MYVSVCMCMHACMVASRDSQDLRPRHGRQTVTGGCGKNGLLGNVGHLESTLGSTGKGSAMSLLHSSPSWLCDLGASSTCLSLSVPAKEIALLVIVVNMGVDCVFLKFTYQIFILQCGAKRSSLWEVSRS